MRPGIIMYGILLQEDMGKRFANADCIWREKSLINLLNQRYMQGIKKN